jgi:hypothetical protein
MRLKAGVIPATAIASSLQSTSPYIREGSGKANPLSLSDREGSIKERGCISAKNGSSHQPADRYYLTTFHRLLMDLCNKGKALFMNVTASLMIRPLARFRFSAHLRAEEASAPFQITAAS